MSDFLVSAHTCWLNPDIIDAMLLQAAEVGNMVKPCNDDLRVLRQWLTATEFGDCFLRGREISTWHEDHDKDFVNLSGPRPEEDQFTHWMSPIMIGIYHKIWGMRRKVSHRVAPEPHTKKLTDKPKHPKVDIENSGVIEYDDSWLKAVGKAFGVLLACLLPVLAILALYFVKNTLRRIGITIGFTAVFGFSLKLLTSAELKEIFVAATA